MKMCYYVWLLWWCKSFQKTPKKVLLTTGIFTKLPSDFIILREGCFTIMWIQIPYLSLSTCRNLKYPWRPKQAADTDNVAQAHSFSPNTSPSLPPQGCLRETERVLSGRLTPEASRVLNRQHRGMPLCLWGPVVMGPYPRVLSGCGDWPQAFLIPVFPSPAYIAGINFKHQLENTLSFRNVQNRRRKKQSLCDIRTTCCESSPDSLPHSLAIFMSSTCTSLMQVLILVFASECCGCTGLHYIQMCF